MKTLELQDMVDFEAGGGRGTAFVCGMTLLASAAVLVGSGGTAAVGVAYVAGAACGGTLGYGAASGDWW